MPSSTIAGRGADVGFDREFSPPTFDQVMIAQGRTAHLGQALAHADRGLSPTFWQASTYPGPAAADDRGDL